MSSIARITTMLWACNAVLTSGLAFDSSKMISESATEFSLMDDAGAHVLHFGATEHGRRLDSTRKIYLKFKAFGESYDVHLHRSASVFVPETKIYAYSKKHGTVHKHDAPEEARSYWSKDHDTALTFLSHDKIMGTLLLHNRSLEFDNKGTDTLNVYNAPHVFEFGVRSEHGLRDPSEHHHAIGESASVSRRNLLEKWFGTNSCYKNDHVTRRFMVGIAVGSELIKKRNLRSDSEAVNFVAAIFNQANLIYRAQLNLVLSVGAIAIVIDDTRKRLDTDGERVSGIEEPIWDDCRDNLERQLDELQKWQPPEMFGSWQVYG